MTATPGFSRRWLLLEAVITVATGLFVAWLSNYLPVGEATKRATVRLYSPVLAAVYPRPESGQAITLVTVGDADLAAYGETWPASLGFHARRIDKIVSLRPKALFVDLLFIDKKPTAEIGLLHGAFCRAHDAGVRVFVAATSAPAHLSSTEVQLYRLAPPRIDACVTPVMPDVAPDQHDQAQWKYPLVRPPEEPPVPEPSEPRQPPPRPAPLGSTQSAAWAMYQAMFATSAEPLPDGDMALVWGARAAKSNEAIMIKQAKGSAGSMGSLESLEASGKPVMLEQTCRASAPWWEAIPGSTLFSKLVFGTTLLPLCPYHQVIPMRAFRIGGFTQGELNAAIGNSTVIIGAEILGGGDVVVSPVHGRLAGAHVHAMALDNLIQFGARYRLDGDVGLKCSLGPCNSADDTLDLLQTVGDKHNLFALFCVVTITLSVMWWREFSLKVASGMETAWVASHGIHELEKPSRLPQLEKLVMVVLVLFMWVLGTPKGSPRHLPFSATFLLGAAKLLLLYMLLPALIFLVGYWGLRQGPLAIGEYAVWPLVAEFLGVGQRITSRIRHWLQAFSSDRPWRTWSMLNSDEPAPGKCDEPPSETPTGREPKQSSG